MPMVDSAEHILLISNENENQQGREKQLVSAGFDVSVAMADTQISTVLLASKPDLVLCDVSDDMAHSCLLARAVRECPSARTTPIVMIAEKLDAELIEEAATLGNIDFLQAPVIDQFVVFRLRKTFETLTRASEAKAYKDRTQCAHQLAKLVCWEWDKASDHVRWSENLFNTLGDHKHLLKKIFPEDRRPLEKALAAMKSDFTAYDLEYRLKRSDKTLCYLHEKTQVLFDEDGEAVGMTGVIQDISSRKKAEQAFAQLAYYDSLTGLPNRFLFKEHMEYAFSIARRKQEKVAIMFLDLDDFKNINDTFGHHAGDQLLQQVAERLMHCLREGDCVMRQDERNAIRPLARLGGDEFTVLLLADLDTKQINDIVKRIIDEVNKPFIIEHHEAKISVSVGVSVFPDDGDDPELILKNADIAMYHAKQKGKNGFYLYDKTMNVVAKRKLSLEQELRRAVEKEQFVLHYQPRIDIENRQVLGVEALLRWQHPQRGLIDAKKFINLVEESNLIVNLGEWVLEKTLPQRQQWAKEFSARLRMGVNLSARQFLDPRLPQKIESLLKRHNVDASMLELEVKENLLLAADDHVAKTLHELKELGARICIDDLGISGASLRRLSDFPFDLLKIDKSFIGNITDNSANATVAKTIMTLGGGLGIPVVAEGVETEQQFQTLANMGCNEMQGYHICRPLSVEAMDDLLMTNLTKSPKISDRVQQKNQEAQAGLHYKLMGTLRK